VLLRLAGALALAEHALQHQLAPAAHEGLGPPEALPLGGLDVPVVGQAVPILAPVGHEVVAPEALIEQAEASFESRDVALAELSATLLGEHLHGRDRPRTFRHEAERSVVGAVAGDDRDRDLVVLGVVDGHWWPPCYGPLRCGI